MREGGEGWVSNQILKKGGLTGRQPLEGVAGKEERDFFQRVSNCDIKKIRWY